MIDVVVISLRVVRTGIGTVKKPVFDHSEWLNNYPYSLIKESPITAREVFYLLFKYKVLDSSVFVMVAYK